MSEVNSGFRTIAANDIIEGLHLSKQAAIIDIGGGDSLLVDALLGLY